ncbi:MAG: hypothetical protein J0H06_00515 [Actinobacteria bacterium]|nr:hypothetical protein [Actinomycetota bacterium]
MGRRLKTASVRPATTVTVEVAWFGAEFLVPAGPHDAEDLRVGTAAAVDFYLHEEQTGEVGWAYPHFMQVPEGPDRAPARVELDRARWERISAEADRQGVSPGELLNYAVVYFCASRGSGPQINRSGR